MATVYITRRERFNAAHKLWNDNWTPEKNASVFGKCSNPNWHGHNYELFVTVKGRPHPDTGYCADLGAISKLIRRKVCEKVDHKNLNLDVDFMKGIMPSTENLAIAVWQQIEKEIEVMGAQLHCVKIFETENNSAEYYGE